MSRSAKAKSNAGALPERLYTLLECEDPLPVVLHADDCPAVLLRFIIQRLSERADLRVGKSLRRSVGILALGVVVQHQQRQPSAVAGLGVLS
jgi:hypothetical protein